MAEKAAQGKSILAADKKLNEEQKKVEGIVNIHFESVPFHLCSRGFLGKCLNAFGICQSTSLLLVAHRDHQ